jgi:hypothetical protein
LISANPLSTPSVQDNYFWVYQTNSDPWATKQPIKWTPYSSEISSAIEQAFIYGSAEIIINELYLIDLKKFVEERVDNPNRQRSIRRCHSSSSVTNDDETEREIRRRERFTFPLEMSQVSNTTADTSYYGSSFVMAWLLAFTDGKLEVTFDDIFPALIHGLKHEGQNESEKVVESIVQSLNSVREQTLGKRERKRMDKLQICCTKLYTKSCYLFRVVNTALRYDDRTKLHSLGPYCYLVYNYIGRHVKDYLLFRHRLLRIFRPTESRSMIIYRGDNCSDEIIKKYQQAAESNAKYFKWLTFVSTSLDRCVAEKFRNNVLYIIELQCHLSNDQFTNLRNNTYFEDEEEILLRPGVQFQVTKVESDGRTRRWLVYVKIVPSYVSNLQ